MRIVEVRGHNVVAGGLLPYRPDLSEEVVDEIRMLADEIESEIEEAFRQQDELPEPGLIRNLSMAMVLKTSAPLFSEAWLAGTVLDPADMELPAMLNAEGDEIEFVRLHCSLAKGTTQGRLRELLNAAPDMKAASSAAWNWIAQPGKEPGSGPKRTGNVTFKAHLESGALSLGMIELKGRKLEANVNSVERAERLRQRLKGILGNQVSDPIMVHQTVGQAMAEHLKEPAPEAQVDLPPEVESQLVKEFYNRHYRETLDEPIPMLNDKSPRAAVKTPEGKEKVVAWLKHLETSDARMCQSKAAEPYDFSWMWRELGILELRK